MGIDTPLYPAAMVVAGRPCLVVGGGRVAARKIRSLLECGAVVTVVAPEVDGAVRSLARNEGRTPLEIQERPYRAGEAAGYRLVVTATGNAQVDRAVHRDADAAGVWVNSADDARNCTFVLPAVHRDGPLTVAVSTGGASPALATWLRRRIAECLGPGLGDLAILLEEARAAIHRRGATTESVDWTALLEGPLPTLVREGRIEEARTLLAAAIESTASAAAST
jgi:siroheme synthase-like protein